MKKILALVLFACLLFPAMSFAGVAGTYEFDKEKMLNDLVPMIIKQRKIPPAMHAMVRTKMKERLYSRDMWMVLSANKKFKGFAKKTGDKTAQLGATGTWSVTGAVLTIKSISVKNKKHTTMTCKVTAKTLACKDARNPKIVVHFNRGKAKKFAIKKAAKAVVKKAAKPAKAPAKPAKPAPRK